MLLRSMTAALVLTLAGLIAAGCNGGDSGSVVPGTVRSATTTTAPTTTTVAPTVATAPRTPTTATTVPRPGDTTNTTIQIG